MTIHHATLKRAQNSGVILTEAVVDGVARFSAMWTERNRIVDGNSGQSASSVLDDMLAVKMAVLEYPGIKLEKIEDGSWDATILGADEPQTFGDISAKVALDEALAECAELEIDPSEPVEGAEDFSELEEEEDKGRVIVADRYRKEYAARGNPDHCGDWLAQQLDGQFMASVTEEDKPMFDWQSFRDALVENGIDMTGKWADLPNSGQRGWVGRYRMNGRQKLEKKVAETGFLMLRGTKIMVPVEEMERLWDKHPDACTTHEEANPKKD